MREIVKSLPYAGFELFETQIYGTSYCNSGYKMDIKNSDTYRFEYIMSGSGCIKVGKDKSETETCDVFFLNNQEEGFYRGYENENWTRMWVCVKGELVEQLIKLYGLKGQHLFKNCRVFNLFDEIMKNAESYEERKIIEQNNAVLIHRIIQAMSNCVSKNNFTPSDAQILRDYIDRNYTRAINNDVLASTINKSESQMIRIFKKNYGTTPYDYALKRKIQTATQMLKNTHMSIREISMELGFRNEHYFSSCFKERTGVTPLKYRKNSVT